MLKHVVMWKFKDGAGGKTAHEHALWMKEHLEQLMEKIPEIRSLEVGVNMNIGDMAYDAVLISVFDDAESMARYKSHPAHLQVSAYCKSVRQERSVVDFES